MPLSTVIETSEAMREDFAALLEKSFESELKAGTIVVGEVIKVERDGLMVDIGGKSEGFVPLKEIPGVFNLEELSAQFRVSQVSEFFIVNVVDDAREQSAHYTLSVRRVMMAKNWVRLAELKEAGEAVEVTVSGTTKGGVIVNIMGFKGFIPASQLRVAKTLNDLVGDTLEAKILEVDKQKNKLILSHREAVFAKKAAQRAETLSRLNEGEVVEGQIVKVTDFGVFVDINGIDGLLPLSEITWRRIQHPSEVLELGQRVTVSVLTVDQRLQRISLSLKRLTPDPWETVHSQFKVGDVLNGRISKLLGSGVLAELAPGIEAYCAYEPGGRQYFMNESYMFRIVSILEHDRKITLDFQGEA